MQVFPLHIKRIDLVFSPLVLVLVPVSVCTAFVGRRLLLLFVSVFLLRVLSVFAGDRRGHGVRGRGVRGGQTDRHKDVGVQWQTEYLTGSNTDRCPIYFTWYCL